MTKEDMSNWKTEHGFGYGSTLDEVVSLIGEPTSKTLINNFYGYVLAGGYDVEPSEDIEPISVNAYVYRWKYPTAFEEGSFLAVYTLTSLHQDEKVTGIVIDVEEAA